MHACSLGLFLVTTALQPLAGGCTKDVMGRPMQKNVAKIGYFSSSGFLNSSLFLQGSLLREGKFEW